MPAAERRLAAILHADVVGYSRLMAEDEDATVRTLNAYRYQAGRSSGSAAGGSWTSHLPRRSPLSRVAAEVEPGRRTVRQRAAVNALGSHICVNCRMSV